MDDNGAVAEEATRAGSSRDVELQESVAQIHTLVRGITHMPQGNRRGSLRGLEGTGGDFAMFAREITDLACLGLGRVTRRLLAALVGVQVSEGASAVAVSRDGLVVNVVYCHRNNSLALLTNPKSAVREGW